MTDPDTPVPQDALEACLRAVLAWQERPMSSASLRARVAGGREVWTVETFLEAADSLGYDVEEGAFDAARPALPLLPAVAATRQGTAIALLSAHEEGQVLVVDPDAGEKPRPLPLEEVYDRLAGATYSLVLRDIPVADAVTGAPRCHMMSLGSQTLML